MTQVVYADILFIINVFITYLLLSLVTVIFRVKRNTLRLILASALGGLFSFYILAPEQHFAVTAIIKLSFSAAIIFTAFKARGTKRFLTLLLGFYTVSFAFAGIMIALWVAVKPGGMVINNSVVYFNISVPILIISGAVCYGVILVAERVISKRIPKNSACDVSITVGNVCVKCRAMIDTGNNLSDTFTGWPVIIAEYRAVQKLIPLELRDFYCKAGDIPEMFFGDFKSRVRTVPYRAVGADGLLPAFRPDSVTVFRASKAVKSEKVIVAVTNESIRGGEYDVLLNCEMT